MTIPTRPESQRLSLPNADGLWGSLAGGFNALPNGYRPILLAILAACFVLRIGTGSLLPNIQHADEVFQVAEQANRSVNGYGIVPWEFRTASRTALLPTLVKPIYAVGASAKIRRVLLAALFCAFSLIPVWVAFQWAGRLYGLRGAILAATMTATWFESVYFAPKPTADAVCGYFLVAALFLARPAARAAGVFLAGFCLMLALGIRVQIAPAVGVALLVAALAGPRQRTAALLGGVATGLIVVGFVEWMWWGVPFQGQWGYLTMELVHRSSTFFASQPVTFFAKEYVLMYGGALPLMVVLMCIGAKRAPVLLITALAVVVPFHLVGHKEYRFVVAALPLVLTLAGLAAADLLARFDRPSRPSTLPTVIGVWLVSMAALSLGDHYRPYWTQSGNHVLAFEEIGEDPGACGVALVGIRWWHTPGYAGLGRNIPIYELTRTEQETRIRAAANYVLLGTKQPAPPRPYVQWREYSRPVQYLYRRPGGCEPDESMQVIRPPGIPGLSE